MKKISTTIESILSNDTIRSKIGSVDEIYSYMLTEKNLKTIKENKFNVDNFTMALLISKINKDYDVYKTICDESLVLDYSTVIRYLLFILK